MSGLALKDFSALGTIQNKTDSKVEENKLKTLPPGASVQDKFNARALPAKDSRDPKKMEAARMFENQFVRQMIREMRKTVPQDGMEPESMASGIFKDQLDDQYADKWVDNGGIGLGDIVYQQLEQKYGNKAALAHAKKTGELLPIKLDGKVGHPENIKIDSKNSANQNRPSEIISKSEKDLFLLKKTQTGFEIKSREALPERVELRSPMAGTVLHAASLGEGKQLVVIGHDQGLGQNSSLVSQFVHTGKNLVNPGDKISQGQAVAFLPAANSAEERAHVVFGLRKGTTVE